MRPSIATAALAGLLLPAAAFCAAASLGQSIAMNRLVTPNGDGKNDFFIFRCYNPSDDAVEGKIFDLAGREVAKMTLKGRYHAATNSEDDVSGEYYDMKWDPNAGGRRPGGVYIYQVTVKTKVYKGTIVVIR